MRKVGKRREFKLEIRLGLALIVLVLVILNVAAHYTLYRVGRSLELQIREELTEAAVVISNAIAKTAQNRLPEGLSKSLKNQYSLIRIEIFPLNYDLAIAIQKGEHPEGEILRFDSTLIASDLSDLILNRPVYRHRAGDEYYLLLFPSEFLGSNYIIALSRSATVLGPIENAMKILIFFGIMVGVITVLVSFRLIHTVLYPFKRLKEEAEKSGHLKENRGDDVGQLIESYEEIIKDLKQKENELIDLNRQITQRAADLEVYNDYILRSIETGIITLDSNGKIATVNKAAGKILNLKEESYIGVHYEKLMNRYPALQGLVESYLCTGQADSNNEISIRLNDENTIDAVVSLNPLADGRGDIIGLTILINNQTEYRKLQQELELNRRLASLGEMSGGLAHQLRNSTAAIIGFARLIEKKAASGSHISDSVEPLLKEAEQAENLVARFLDYARPLELNMEKFDINRLIDDIIKSARRKFPEIEFDFQPLPDKQALITGDPLLLKQAVGNPVDNACQAYDGLSGDVGIRIEKSGTSVVINIEDRGRGIPDDIRNEIFTPFFSGSPSGTGLGLPLTQKIVAMHGGQIDIRPAAPKGTVFCITLPVEVSVECNKADALSKIPV